MQFLARIQVVAVCAVFCLKVPPSICFGHVVPLRRERVGSGQEGYHRYRGQPSRPVVVSYLRERGNHNAEEDGAGGRPSQIPAGQEPVGIDDDISYAEKSRSFRRTYYTHKDWVRHRRSDRFVKVLGSTLESGIARQLGKEIGLVTATAVFTILFNGMLVEGFEDLNGSYYHPIANLQMAHGLTLPTAPFALSGPVLGLLLVFRTNASYSRWDQARKAYGAIVNHSRNIVRMGACWESRDDDVLLRRERLDRLAKAVWAFSRSTECHLLGSDVDEQSYRRDVQTFLPANVARSLIDARHRPTRALHEVTSSIRRLDVSEYERVEMEKSVVALCDALGTCERIFSSPVPLVYTRHTARFLVGWLLSLPLALYEPFSSSWNHLGMIPLCIVFSFFFLGIEELAIQLEEPFSILPLQQLVEGIRLSMDEHVDWHFEGEETGVNGTNGGDSFSLSPFHNNNQMDGN